MTESHFVLITTIIVSHGWVIFKLDCFVSELNSFARRSPCSTMCVYKDYVIGGYGSGHIRIFNHQDGSLVAEITAHARWINALDVNPSGLVWRCSYWNSVLTLWSSSLRLLVVTTHFWINADFISITKRTLFSDGICFWRHSSQYLELNRGEKIFQFISLILHLLSHEVTGFTTLNFCSTLIPYRTTKIALWSGFHLMKAFFR